MRNRKLRPFDLAAAVSLSLFVAAVWLWMRNFVELYRSEDGLSNAFSSRGSIYIKHRTVRDFSMQHARDVGAWSFVGFGGVTGVRADGQTERWRWFHVWPVAAASAVLPVVWWVRERRDRRRAAREANRRCVRCGYDLRATPGRCPECGTETPLTG